jgi:hypothetical protein
MHRRQLPTVAARASIGSTLLAIASIAACDRPQPRRESATMTPRVAPDRRFDRALLDTLWTAPVLREGDPGDPQAMVADSSSVYVFDSSTQRLLALDGRSGAERWSLRNAFDSILGAEGAMALAPRRAGGLYALGAGSSNVVLTVTSRGSVGPHVAVDLPDGIQSLCELPDRSLLVQGIASNAGVIVASRDGKLRTAHAYPWTDLRRASGLVSQLLLAPTARGCVAALALGRGFAFVDGGGFGDTLPYVERVVLPTTRREVRPLPHGEVISTVLSEHTRGALDVAANASAMFIAFDGTSAARRHLVDVYRLDGAYQESLRTPRAVSAIAAANDVLYLLTRRDGVPTVVALRWTPRDSARLVARR